MPQMSLADYREELQARGHEFEVKYLDRYIAWGWQHVSRRARWAWAEKVQEGIIIDPGGFSILLSSVSAFSSLKALTVTSDTRNDKLRAMSEVEFYDKWAIYDWVLAGSAPPASRGEPDSYYIVRNQIFVLPPPQVQTEFAAHYWRKADAGDLDSATDVPPTPIDWDEIILTASEIRCHDRARQYEASAVSTARLEELLADVLAEDELRTDENQERVEKELWH